MKDTAERDYSKVVVIYCPCGHHYETVGHPDTIMSEVGKATLNGQKTEIISIEDYRKTSHLFGCDQDLNQPK